LLTCEQFLQELDEYLDPNFDVELKRWLESHVSECPSCFAVVDTTQKIMRLYKGVEPKTLPEDVKTRLLKALEKKMAATVNHPGSPN
jgi:hypothetical protein